MGCISFIEASLEKGDSSEKRQEKLREVKERLLNEMGIRAFVPKSCGGNSNDGNTGRKAFNNPEKFANITGLDVQLIKRIGVIL